MAQPFAIWVASDGRAGNENQALGLAEEVARRRSGPIEIKRIAWRGVAGRLPWWALPAPRLWLTGESGVAPPWPDLWIAAGRATLPISIRLHRWSSGRTFVVQLQRPHAPSDLFDLVVPPKHDRLNGRNVLPITGAPNRITAERLAQELARFRRRLDPLPRPRAAVVIGGRSKAFDLTAESGVQLAQDIVGAVRASGGSLMATFSRRTPEPARLAMTQVLAGAPGFVWDGAGENPYFAFLAAAEVILVTEDSANMATEAASTGKPVLILPLEGASEKFARLHADLSERGAARPFAGDLTPWTYPPLAETRRAASEILRRLDLPRERRWDDLP